jgi:putative membrane protein
LGKNIRTRIEFKDTAEERTHLAKDRTYMANQRTFSAWLRTGLTVMAAGLAVARFIHLSGFPILNRIIGGLLILSGGTVYAVAYMRFKDEYNDLKEEGVHVQPIWPLALLTVVLLISSVFSFLLIFFQE